ncbi:MAG: tRNA (adenosine(37)-N6)-threonylcarbamoyltransferase complex ATPase subunit type 1 TsaE [Patescibacteria group bacterium]|nr:tRNA (adenosine(37)-N6)-threonylcarbamoyltransferase complex ATPase subunit type 1 TsaE [Patescibacteria group bacterium]
MKTIISHKTAETFKLGHKISSALSIPATLALWGELGTGKTQFTKGLARGLGIEQLIQSPTFVLQKTYPFQRKKNFFRLCHYDFYRLKGLAKTQELEILETLQDPNTLNVVEWPALVFKRLPINTYSIYFTHGSTPNERKIRLPAALAKML